MKKILYGIVVSGSLFITNIRIWANGNDGGHDEYVHDQTSLRDAKWC